jgi:hypothetical protein
MADKRRKENITRALFRLLSSQEPGLNAYTFTFG